MIRRLTPDNLAEATALFSAAVSAMIEAGILQWDEVYPDATIIRDDILTNHMYGIFDQGSLTGVIVLNEMQLEPYAGIQWLLDDSRPLVIHRLCVHPAFQNRGLAGILLRFAEEFAFQNKYRSIRLDAFKYNPAALALYDRLGYKMRGVIELRKGPFCCFEKIIIDPSRH